MFGFSSVIDIELFCVRFNLQIVHIRVENHIQILSLWRQPRARKSRFLLLFIVFWCRRFLTVMNELSNKNFATTFKPIKQEFQQFYFIFKKFVVQFYCKLFLRTINEQCVSINYFIVITRQEKKDYEIHILPGIWHFPLTFRWKQFNSLII